MRAKPLLYFASSLAAVAMMAPAYAQESVNVTDTAVIEMRIDNDNGSTDDDDYGVFVNRLNVNGTGGNVTAGVRVDSEVFVAAPEPEPGNAGYESTARLERINLQYRLGDWTVSAGDYPLQLGRGIALSMRTIEGTGRDVSVQGGLVEWSTSDHGMTAFAGRANAANMDSVSQRVVDNVNDVLVGGSYELRALEFGNLGAYGVYSEPEFRLLGERTTSGTGGVYVDMPTLTDWLGVYVEGDFQGRSVAGTSEQGFAGYMANDVFIGDTTLLIEGMIIDGVLQVGSQNTALGSSFIYNQAPTLERYDQEVASSENVAGGRLRVEHFFYDAGLLTYVNGMVRVNQFGEEASTTLVHGYGGVEYDYGDASTLELSGGYRNDSNEDASILTMVHAEADWLQEVGDGYSVHIQQLHESRTLADRDFVRGSTFVGFDRSGLGGLTFEFGYDTQIEDQRNLFYAGHLVWEALDELTVRVTGGTQRGGIKCISGVCRNFPSFAGGRVEVVGRF